MSDLTESLHHLRALRLTHQTAPLHIREQMYLSDQECQRVLEKLDGQLNMREALVISTCNRTEVYYVAGTDYTEEIIKILCVAKGISQNHISEAVFQSVQQEEKAVYELFSVAMGLQSSILGDLQISGQIKQAYRLSHEAEMAQAFLHRLMHTIFHANKRVQIESGFRSGAASVSYAAAELAAEWAGEVKNPTVLVLGLGEMGRDVARNLKKDSYEAIWLCNRTDEKAIELAVQTETEAVPFSSMKDFAAKADIIISAASVSEPLIVPQIFADDPDRTRFILDLSVPRSVDEVVDAFSHTRVQNIDDIHARTNAALERRQAAIPMVEQIIGEEVQAFLNWRSQQAISPVIHRLKDALSQIQAEEMDHWLKKASPNEKELVQKVTNSMINKIVKLQVLQLKDACKRGEQDGLIQLISELFDLERV
ncbi:MAG: glutamyl-tRNA reductase [Bacteroidota bacterium]